MKFTRKYLEVLFVALILCFTNPLSLKAQIFDVDSLKFTILLDKEEYLVNEPIWVTVKLENISQKEIFVGSLDPVRNFLHLYIVSLTGDTLRGGCIMGNVPSPKYPSLGAGEQDIVFIDLIGPVCTYGIEHEDALYWRRIPEGEYTLQAKMHDFYHKNLNERKDIFSNKRNFKVEKLNREEKKVYDLLLGGYKKFKDHKQKESIDEFLKIARKFPRSAYVDGAYHMLSYFYWTYIKRLAGYEGEDYNSIANRFIQNYPNSGLVAEFIEGLRPGPGKPTERKKFYEDIIKKYPNTKAAMYAENKLDKWRRGKIWVDEPIE